ALFRSQAGAGNHPEILRRPSGHRAHRTRLAPRPAYLQGPQQHSSGHERPGRGHRFDLARRHDRPQGPCKRRRRRSAVLRGLRRSRMSRIAKYPVELPKGVEASIQQDQITVKGPLGTLTQALTGDVTITLDDGKLTFVAANDSRHAGAMSGTVRALVANMVTGVSKGFERKLNLVGVGFRAQAQGDAVKLQLGF